MEHIIKFPKEKVLRINQIRQLYESHDYRSIAIQKDELLDSYDTFKDDSIYEILVEALVRIREFERAITLADELHRRGYERWSINFYALVSFLALEDIYQAKTYIRRSSLLQDEAIKIYLTKDYPPYSSILSITHIEYYDVASTLLLANLILELAHEVVKGQDISRKYILMRCFDVLNIMIELAYDDQIIEVIEEAIRLIFEIDV